MGFLGGDISILVRLYRDDISKRAGSRALQVRSIFDAIPGQLNKENKRFELKSLRSKAQYERYANDFAWLVSAGAVVAALAVVFALALVGCGGNAAGPASSCATSTAGSS